MGNRSKLLIVSVGTKYLWDWLRVCVNLEGDLKTLRVDLQCSKVVIYKVTHRGFLGLHTEDWSE